MEHRITTLLNWCTTINIEIDERLQIVPDAAGFTVYSGATPIEPLQTCTGNDNRPLHWSLLLAISNVSVQWSKYPKQLFYLRNHALHLNSSKAARMDLRLNLLSLWRSW